MHFDPKKPKRGRTDWKRVDALTEQEIERAARSDPDCPPLTKERLKRMRRVPQVRIIRMSIGMTQEEFAEAFGLSLPTLRDWEQGRFEPDQAAKTLLRVVAKNPEAVKAALKKSGAAAR